MNNDGVAVTLSEILEKKVWPRRELHGFVTDYIFFFLVISFIVKV